MSHFTWTKALDRQLAARYGEGGDVGVLAAELGCSVAALRTRASTLGLLRRNTRKHGVAQGNAVWLVGPALAGVMSVAPDEFCADLLSELDKLPR